MKENLRSSRLIMNEMERLQSLSGDELKSYLSELRTALRREYKALYCRVHRLYSEGQKLSSVLSSEVSSEMSSEMSSSDKEERSEKENLPPTPPIREKAKKEENASPIGSAAARASVHMRVREANQIPTWEMVVSRAKSTIGCNNIAWLREWFNEMNCAAWCDGDGNPIHNWGRALGIAWRYKDVDAARRDPSRFQKPIDKELEEAQAIKERQKKFLLEQSAIAKARILAEEEAMNERH
jgi:hypothetical protein